MRRVIRKRIRRTGEGVDLAADINADIVVNVGGSKHPPTARPPAARTDRPTPAPGGDSDSSEARPSDAPESGGNDG